MRSGLARELTDALPVVPLGDAIPKVLHQTMSSWDALTPEMLTNVSRLKADNPDWSYRFYSDEDCIAFIRSAYPPIVEKLYSKIRPEYGPARADLFRYLLLYREGGVYLDIKSTALEPLSSVIAADDKYILCQWSNPAGDTFGMHREVAGIPGGEFQQWHIAAAPGHPFLRAVLLRVLTNVAVYNPLVHGTGKLGVLRVTGPIAYSLAIAPLTATEPYRQASAEELGLAYNSLKGGHRSHFQGHYAGRTDSITSLSKVWVGPAALYSALKVVRRRLRRNAP